MGIPTTSWEKIFETEYGTLDYLVRYTQGTKLYFITAAYKRTVKPAFSDNYIELQYTIRGADMHKSKYDKEMRSNEVLAKRMDFIPYQSLIKGTRKAIHDTIDTPVPFSSYENFQTDDNQFKRLSQFLVLMQADSCAYDTFEEYCSMCDRLDKSVKATINGYDDMPPPESVSKNYVDAVLGCDVSSSCDSVANTIASSNPCGEVLVYDGSSGTTNWGIVSSDGTTGLYDPYNFQPIPAVPAPMEEKNDVKLLRKKRKKRKTVRFSEQKPVVLKS